MYEPISHQECRAQLQGDKFLCPPVADTGAATGSQSDAPLPGPSLLVLVLIYCDDKLLMLRRGCEPYVGRWAPPGGFVEHGESMEAAAVREVWEETRLILDSTQLLPSGVISVTHINQVHQVFFVYLDTLPVVVPVPPESIAVRWFTEAESRQPDAGFWDPGAHVDYAHLYETLRERRGDLFQWNEDYQRIISPGGSIRYVWRKGATAAR